MALTVTARGSGTNNVSNTSFNVSPSGNFAARSWGVLLVTADNGSTGGATNDFSATLTDSLGNTWTLRQAPIYDNGAASAGIQGAIYTSDCSAGAPQTSTTIPISTGAAATAKGWSLYEVAPPAGASVVSYITGAVGTGATVANPSIVTGTITVGDALFCAYHAENVAAVTGDSDTTNGSWGTLVSVTVGTTTSGIRHATQHKVQTTANSTQTWNTTVTSQDNILSWVQLRDVPSTVSSSFTANAVIKSPRSSSFTANAVIKKTTSGSLTANAVINATATGSFTVDAVISVGSTAGTPHDDFTRTVSNGWGTADVGGAWTPETASQHAVNGSAATITAATLTSSVIELPSTYTDSDNTIQVSVNKLPLGSGKFHSVYLFARRSDGDNWYRLIFSTDSAGQIDCYIQKDVATVSTTLATSLAVGTMVVGDVWNLELEALGTTVRARVWKQGASKPGGWTLSATDSSLASGKLAIGEFNDTTNGPTVWTFDNLNVTTLTADAVIKRTQTGSFTANAVIKKAQTGSFATDAVKKATVTSSFTANAVIKKTITGSFAANAVIKRTQSGSLTLNAVARRTQTGSFTISALIAKTLVYDTFNREVDGSLNLGAGLGTSDSGYHYATYEDPGTYWLVQPGTPGYALGVGVGAYLPTINSGLLVFDFETQSDLSALRAFSISTANETIRVGYNAGSTVTIRNGPLNGETVWYDLTAAANTTYRVKVAFVPTDTPQLRFKVWEYGTTEPDWQATGAFSGFGSSVPKLDIPGSTLPDAFIRGLQLYTFETPWANGRELPINATIGKVVWDDNFNRTVVGGIGTASDGSSYGLNKWAGNGDSTPGDVDGSAFVVSSGLSSWSQYEGLSAIRTGTVRFDFWTGPFSNSYRSAWYGTGYGRYLGVERYPGRWEVSWITSGLAAYDDGGGDIPALENNAWYRVRGTITPSRTLITIWKVGDPEPAPQVEEAGDTFTDVELTYSWFYVDALNESVSKVDNLQVVTFETPWRRPNFFWIDAVIRQPQAGSITADAVIRRGQTGTLTANAVVLKAQAGSFTISAATRRQATGSLTANAVIRRTQSGSFTLNAVIRRGQTGSVTANAVVRATVSGSLTVNAVVKATVAGSFTANAVLLRAAAGSFTANATIRRTPAASLTADAVIKRNQTGSFAVQAWVQGTNVSAFSVDAVLRRTRTGSFTIDAVLVLGTQSGSFAVNAVIRRGATGSLTADAVIRRTASASFTANADIKATLTSSFTANAVLLRAASGSFTIAAVRRATTAGSLTANAVLRATPTGSFTINAVVQRAAAGSFTANAILRRPAAGSWTLDATLLRPQTGSFATNAVVRATPTGSLTLNAFVAGHLSVDAVIRRVASGSFGINAFIPGHLTADAVIRRVQTGSFTIGAFVQGSGVAVFSVDAVVRRTQAGSFTADAVKRTTGTGSFTANAILRRNQTGSFSINALIRAQATGSFTVGAVKKASATQSFTLDAQISQSAVGSVTISAVLLKSITGAFSAQAVLFSTRSGTFTIDAIRRVTATGSWTLDAVIEKTTMASVTANAVIKAPRTGGVTADAVILSPRSGSFALDAYVSQQSVSSITIDAVITAPAATDFFTINALLRRTQAGSFTISALVRVAHVEYIEAQLSARMVAATISAPATMESALVSTGFAAATLSARTSAATLTARVIAGTTFYRRGSSFTVDAVIVP